MSLRIAALAAAAALIPTLAVAAPADRAARVDSMIQQRFDAVDTNRDGKIDAAEIEAERAARFAAVDRNKDGTIDQAEFEQMVEQRRQQAIQARFQRSDADKSGTLSAAEFDKRSADMLTRLDTDKDGAISLEEMRAGMKRHGGKRHSN